MPGIFGWKNRILGRKTPEPERAVQIQIPSNVSTNGSIGTSDSTVSNSSDITPPIVTPQAPPVKRSVRFNEMRNEYEDNSYGTKPDWKNEYGEARVIGSVSPAHGKGNLERVKREDDWEYADEVQVRVAPLATTEEDMRLRGSIRRSNAGAVLQSLRETDSIDRRRGMPNTATLNVPVTYGGRVSPSQFSSTYGSSVGSESPYVSRDHYREPEAVPTPTNFYPIKTEVTPFRTQLDDMNVVFLQYNDEVKRIILPPQIAGLAQIKMAFLRAFPNLTRNYIETPNVKIYIQDQSKAGAQIFYELEDPRDIKNKSVLKLKEKYSGTHNGLQSPVRFLDQPDYLSETEFDNGRQRMPPAMFRPASALAHAEFGQQKIVRQKSYDPYMDSYASDTSSIMDSRASAPRSGSTTPVIDRESRVRMETMERQLAGLSSLVHSALVSKGMSENTHKDMADLRKEILALHPEIRESSEEPMSIPESLSSHTQHQLGALKNKIHQANTEIHQLRRTAQANAHTAKSLIKEAGEQINFLIQEKIGGGSGSVSSRQSESDVEERERDRHAEKLAALLNQLTEFEQNVENVRSCVLQTNKKLRMSEVEKLTEGLTEIGRSAAALKTEFPPIQEAIEKRIKADMERIVREEKFIKEQTAAVDQTLRRCKGLANIMVTMKKLAMVQDPSLRSKKEKEVLPSTNGHPSLPPANAAALNVQAAETAKERPAVFSPTVDIHTQPLVPDAPPVPPAPKNYQTTASSLDGVLDEVGQPGIPPRPPSRFSVNDVRNKFTKPPELPEQIKSIIEDATRRASPAPERDVVSERRHDLEERQERLAEKQKQLKSQFQQLQELTPLP